MQLWTLKVSRDVDWSVIVEVHQLDEFLVGFIGFGVEKGPQRECLKEIGMFQAEANLEYRHRLVCVRSGFIPFSVIDQRLDQVQQLIADVEIALWEASEISIVNQSDVNVHFDDLRSIVFVDLFLHFGSDYI